MILHSVSDPPAHLVVNKQPGGDSGDSGESYDSGESGEYRGGYCCYLTARLATVQT
jgi:hypothetical protein